MKVWESNVLRATAKKVVAESAERTKGLKMARERDQVNAEIITRYHRDIEGSFTRVQLVYMIGVVRGILRDPS